jgi:hypothetical protein
MTMYQSLPGHAPNREPDVVGYTGPHAVDYWSDHPDVQRAELNVGLADSVIVSLWLKRDWDVRIQPPSSEEPQREPDLVISGFEGEGPPKAFWARLPGLAYLDTRNHEDGWIVALWLLQPELLDIDRDHPMLPGLLD